jgi:hypothetical protein
MQEITDIDLDELASELATIEGEISVAATVAETTDDDPMARISLDQILAGHGLLKGDQSARTFVGSKAIHRSPEVTEAEKAARDRQHKTMRQRQRRQMEKRARIAVEREAKPIDKVRLGACFALLGNLTGVIANLTMQRYNRFRRVLGDIMVDDLAQDSIIRIAEALARTNDDIVMLAEATLWLKDAPQPYVSADGPQGSARLLGTIVRVIGRVIVDNYRANTTVAWVESIDDNGKRIWVQKDTTLESFELLETVAHNTRTDVDDMLSHTKADNKPKHKGSAPGMREKRLFARMVIDTAITARGLDWLANMMLDDERRRTDGSFKWTENADTIWAGFQFPAMNTDEPRLKAHYARRAVTIAFAFLPELIITTYDLINTPEFMWHVGSVPTNRVVEVAAKVRELNSTHEHRHAIDGGAGLEYTMHLIENGDARHRALLAILGAEFDDYRSSAEHVTRHTTQDEKLTSHDAHDV